MPKPKRILLDMRRKEAQERQKARDLLTPQDQIARLDQMFGKGKGAKRERSRLLEQISVEKKQKSVAKSSKGGKV